MSKYGKRESGFRMKSRNNPLVSIITVCLNSEKTIEQTIKSVLGQTYKNIEYIIVDGQSSDGTLNIVNKYKSQIAKIVSEPDEGLYYAMNKGISMATGDIVGIINSDDWYEPYTVEEVVTCFHETNAAIVYGDLLEVGVEQNQLMVLKNIEDLREDLKVPHPTFFVKKEVYDIYGQFDVQYKIAADLDFVLRILNKGIKFERVKKVLANFRMGGLSSRNDELCNKEIVQIGKKYCEEMDDQERLYYLKQIDNVYKGYYFNKLIENNPQKICDKVLTMLQYHNAENIVIFGSGKWGKSVGKVLLDNQVQLSYYVDNDQSKWGKTIDSVAVMSPQILENFNGVVLILINKYSSECLKQIEEMNNSKIECVDWKQLLV